MQIQTKRSRTIRFRNTSTFHPPSQSAVFIADNENLLTEILVRLPIRSIIRFKSVSKCWLSLLTNPYFSLLRNPKPIPSAIFLHLSALVGNPEVDPKFDFVPFDHDKALKPPFRRLNFIDDRSGISILQSCNGLLLCCSFRGNEQKRNYYVYNPTTKQFTTLPRLQNGLIHGMNLAFDPSKSPNYKVVCVRSSETVSDHYQIEIYSSETGPWKISGRPFTTHFDAQYKKGVYWNNSIYWFSYWEGSSLLFNMDRESVERVPIPPQFESAINRSFPYFGECGDHLHLVGTPGSGSNQFTVYEMERDCSKWFVKYRVDLDSLPIAFPEVTWSYFDPSDLHNYVVDILLLFRGEKDEDSFLVLHVPGKVLRYNFEDKTLNKLYDLKTGEPETGSPYEEGSMMFIGSSDAFPYIESLSYV